ncbi:MAG: lytic transglycosylase [Candidatus Pelagibacter sp.]|nr:lytic transglycosylase [Candidatus Pelagibacter sp.]|tara:strand:+ start:63546 stop:64139 length:594 start_codon:yes stop_codon:yes gene_type:complete
MKKNIIICSLFFFISSCTSIPKNTLNVCNIFSEKYLWYKFAKKTERKWGAPIELQMAIIKKESGFDWLAKPERTKIFKFIPWKRPSSSFGYSQAVIGTWDMYKKSTGNTLASRVLFKDSSDFIGWYVNQTYKRLKISKKNYFRQYLAYHEGWKNYKHYNKKSNVVGYAKQVSIQAKKYRSQLNRCKRKLNKKKYIIF